jgi:hypothetical protein
MDKGNNGLHRCNLHVVISPEILLACCKITQNKLCYLCSAKVITSAANTSTVMYHLGTVSHVLTASHTRGRTGLCTHTAPNLLWNVGNVFKGELYGANTICKYFNANFILIFHVFLFFWETVLPGQ